jgi:hypothetical protein
MGLVYPGVPPALADFLRSQAGVGDFVETGTATGKTALWASQRFARVYTIERSPQFFAQAQRSYGQTPNLTMLQGDSRALLPSVVGRLQGPALFWLDAHWMAGESYGEGDECPLLEEIALIDAGRLDHLLLIDDARLFLAPPPRPHRAEQWPDLVQLIAALTARVPDRAVVVIDDVIVAVPAALRPALTSFCQDAATASWEASRRKRGRWPFRRK